MDMQLYTLHVVPAVVIFYGVFVLFMHPPVKIIGASLAAGLVMALINIVGDVAAIHTSLWYYNASGLVAQLPLPLYTTSLFILGGLAYLLIWRLWRGSSHWAALLLLAGVPVLGFLRDLWQAGFTHAGFLTWQSSLAAPLDFVLWLTMFFAGYLVFRVLAPARQHATPAEMSADSSPAVDRQK
ncbi:MAG TPA: hypothetical protein VFV38_03195 [Ktedonobacteraceae bacterium]|nr:hypothetical protein [Ktedonobacteraceae bacterium]